MLTFYALLFLLLPFMLAYDPPPPRDIRLVAYLGDRQHGMDVTIALQTVDENLKAPWVTARAQAAWLKRFAPHLILVPGLNDHSLSTIFEYAYWEDPSLRGTYLTQLYRNISAT